MLSLLAGTRHFSWLSSFFLWYTGSVPGFQFFDVMGFVTVEVNDFNNSLLRLFKWVHTGYSVASLYRSSPFAASLVGFFCEL